MVDTGITLSTALDSIAEQEANPALKAVLIDLKSRVEAGEDFSVGPGPPSAALRQDVRRADQGQRTDRHARRNARHGRRTTCAASSKRGRRSGPRWPIPAIMAVLAIGVTIFLLTYILPKFEPLFTRKGVKLPTPTIVMMTASDLLHRLLVRCGSRWPSCSLVDLSSFGRRTEPGRKILDWLKINLPIVGPMSRKVTHQPQRSHAGHDGGQRRVDARSDPADGRGRRQLLLRAGLAARARRRSPQGQPICRFAARGEPLFPPTLVQMIGAGEETGKLDMVLGKVSTLLRPRSRNLAQGHHQPDRAAHDLRAWASSSAASPWAS